MTPPKAPLSRGALRRALDALLWAVLGAIVAPLVLAVGVALVTLVLEPGAPVIGVMLYYLSFSLFASIAFALAPYALLLVAWVFVVPRLASADRSRTAVVVVTAALALPAGIFVMLANDGAALAIFAPIWISAWVGLLLPRLVVPRLAPGAFARDLAPLRPEPSDA